MPARRMNTANPTATKRRKRDKMDPSEAVEMAARARTNAVLLALEAETRKPSGDRPRRSGRFEAMYDDDMDSLASYADDRDVDIGSVELAWEAIQEGDRHLTRHEDVVERSGLGYHEARKATAVLSDMNDIHEAYDDDWNLYWVRCDEHLREMCAERRISLYRYFEMYEELREFQDKVVGWYVRRNRRQQQPINLTELKEKYVHKLQREYFPGKPVKRRIESPDEAPDDQTAHRDPEGWYVDGEWSRHIAARYLRTAQDEIVRSFDLTY